MKKIFDFFSASQSNDFPVNKKSRLNEEIPAEIGVTEETITEPSEIMPSDSVLGSSAAIEQLQPDDADWPACWTLDQKNEFCTKYDWLSIHDKKLGCFPCQKVGSLGVEAKMGMKVSKEWSNNQITYFGIRPNRKQQLILSL